MFRIRRFELPNQLPTVLFGEKPSASGWVVKSVNGNSIIGFLRGGVQGEGVTGTSDPVIALFPNLRSLEWDFTTCGPH